MEHYTHDILEKKKHTIAISLRKQIPSESSPLKLSLNKPSLSGRNGSYSLFLSCFVSFKGDGGHGLVHEACDNPGTTNTYNPEISIISFTIVGGVASRGRSGSRGRPAGVAAPDSYMYTFAPGRRQPVPPRQEQWYGGWRGRERASGSGREAGGRGRGGSDSSNSSGGDSVGAA